MSNKTQRKISYREAINEALIQEMERDSSVFVYGLGAPDHKRIFGTTNDLVEKFGKERCFDTPLSEDSMMGVGLGAAIKGLRPIHVHIRVDFLLLAMNQLANMVSNIMYTSGGELKAPLVVRAVIGRGWGQGPQHSKSMLSTFSHIPGLKVIAPTTPKDVKGLLISAIRDNNPVLCFEHRWLYWQEDEVPEEPYTIPIGEPIVHHKGDDITVVANSWMNVEALKAAQILEKRGVGVEIVDPRTLSPLNDDKIIKSVKKTGRCIVADYDWVNYGASGEIAARVSHKCFNELKLPVERLGFAPTPCPTVRKLENEFYPSAPDIIRTTERMLDLSPADLSNEEFFSHENKFKGPF